MKRLSIAVLAVVLLSLRHGASAQATTGYRTVDAVEYDGYTIHVTGVPEGGSTASEVEILFQYNVETRSQSAREMCYRALLLALSKPGQYLVQGGPNLCRLKLATP